MQLSFLFTKLHCLHYTWCLPQSTVCRGGRGSGPALPGWGPAGTCGSIPPGVPSPAQCCREGGREGGREEKEMKLVLQWPVDWLLTCAPGAVAKGRTGWPGPRHSWSHGTGWNLVSPPPSPASLWTQCWWASRSDLAREPSGLRSREWRLVPWRTLDSSSELSWASWDVTCQGEWCTSKTQDKITLVSLIPRLSILGLGMRQ